MNQRRRRANNFTDSLNSFQGSELDSEIQCSMSQDSLDEIRSKSNHNSDIISNSKHSIILAGSSPKNSFLQNSSISIITSSEVQPAPDLNKRIDLFQAEQICNKIEDNKENNNPQYSKKVNDIFEEQTTSNNKLEINMLNQNSKRDTNYNIDESKSNVLLIPKQKSLPKITSIIKLSFVPNCINEGKQICDKNCEDDINNETKEFETILCSLDNQLNQIKEGTQTQQIFKRLSDKFVYSPKNFTERLLTIIEESVINNDENPADTSAVNLSRLTAEFRKICKFIEDESCLEWPPSPLSPPAYMQPSISPACNKSVNTKSTNEKTPVSTSVPTTPLSGIDIIKKRFFNKMSKHNYNGSSDNVMGESSIGSFENLEAQCNRLFPEEKEYAKPLRRSLSLPSLMSMSQIHNICEQQMASLNMSTADVSRKEKTPLNTPNLLGKCLFKSPAINKSNFSCSKLKEFKLKTMQDNDKISYSKKKSRKLTDKSEVNNAKTDRLTSDYTAIDPDELEKTLLQDIAEKRKRCLDTARLISEINADPYAIEAHKTLRMSPMFETDNELNSLSHDENKFLQTLMSCKDYQTYLEKQKPLFKLLQRSNVSTPETSLKNIEKSDAKYDENKDAQKENLNVRKTVNVSGTQLSPRVKSGNLYKSPLSKKQGAGKVEKGESTKQKFFVTPGKTPPNKDCRKKKVYFPTMNSPTANTIEKNIVKSPHAEGLYRLNYTTIISPVGMYIRGTDMQLIKNVRAKPDPLLLTPGKRSVKASPNSRGNSRQNTPSKEISKTQQKTPLKINLSPKIGANKEGRFTTTLLENDSTPKSHFVLPKVSYKLPSQVRTIREHQAPKQGTRVQKLLETARNKVVIRHEGRINSAQKGESTSHDGVCEINYDPEDESIHIEQAANKTNFIHVRHL